MPAEGGEIPGTAMAVSPSGSTQTPRLERRKEITKRVPDEWRNRGEFRHRGRTQPGSESRGGAAERGERFGQRSGARDDKTRSTERPPDPNSPFAKLLLLKARLEEKNNNDG